jgi:hypothetical protein
MHRHVYTLEEVVVLLFFMIDPITARHLSRRSFALLMTLVTMTKKRPEK